MFFRCYGLTPGRAWLVYRVRRSESATICSLTSEQVCRREDVRFGAAAPVDAVRDPIAQLSEARRLNHEADVFHSHGRCE